MGQVETFYLDEIIRNKPKKDGTHQVLIKVRIPEINFQHDFPVDYMLSGKVKKLSLTKHEFTNRNNEQYNDVKNFKKIINRSLYKYEEIIEHLIKSNLPVSKKLINEYYKKNPYDITQELEIEEVRKHLYDVLPDNEVDNYSNKDLFEISNNISWNNLQIDPSDNIVDFLPYLLLKSESDLIDKRDREEINKVKNNLDRCHIQYHNNRYPKSNERIIDVLGYYWTLKEANDARIITKYDTKIILRVAEYIFLTEASNLLIDFNDDWIKNFLLYLRDEGYIDSRKFKNYTPLEVYDLKDQILEKASQRKSYSESSYEMIIKAFKRYIKGLESYTKLLDNLDRIHLEKFTLEKLKNSDADYSEEYTQKDHYVDVSELKKMMHHKSENEDINKSIDLFFIQVFSSGNRSIDKDITRINTYKGTDYIEVKHSKTSSKNITGFFKPLRLILEKYNNQLPKIKFRADKYNELLKELATEIGLNREIEFITSYLLSPKR